MCIPFPLFLFFLGIEQIQTVTSDCEKYQAFATICTNLFSKLEQQKEAWSRWPNVIVQYTVIIYCHKSIRVLISRSGNHLNISEMSLFSAKSLSRFYIHVDYMYVSILQSIFDLPRGLGFTCSILPISYLRLISDQLSGAMSAWLSLSAASHQLAWPPHSRYLVTCLVRKDHKSLQAYTNVVFSGSTSGHHSQVSGEGQWQQVHVQQLWRSDVVMQGELVG